MTRSREFDLFVQKYMICERDEKPYNIIIATISKQQWNCCKQTEQERERERERERAVVSNAVKVYHVTNEGGRRALPLHSHKKIPFCSKEEDFSSHGYVSNTHHQST